MTDSHQPTAKGMKSLFNQLTKSIGIGSSSTSSRKIGLKEAAKLRSKYTKFRILIIGRANAGKTTVLKRVCNTTEDPVYHKINPTSKRGIHDVHDEFSFENNPGFIFHDSPGFEAGGEEELKAVMSFIRDRANSEDVEDQIHAIWFCFDPDVSRPLLSLEENFFNEERAGNVPVVAIFSKFDDLISQIYERDKTEEENVKIGLETLEERFERPLRAFKYPPRAYVRFESLHENEGNHQEQVGKLIEQTSKSIDVLALKMLFVTVQKNNLKVCIESAVNRDIFSSVDDMRELIFRTASWFGHYYFSDFDYSKKNMRIPNWNNWHNWNVPNWHNWNVNNWHNINNWRMEAVDKIVSDHFKTPCLHAFIAILICLEHSFWLVQKRIDKSFSKAWDLYHNNHHAALGRRLEDYLMSKESNDWFAERYEPSEEECVELRKFVLENLLPRPI